MDTARPIYKHNNDIFFAPQEPRPAPQKLESVFRLFVSFEFSRDRHFHGRHTVAILCHMIFYSTYHEPTTPIWEPATPQNLPVLKPSLCTRSIFRQSTDGSEYLTAEVNIVEEEQHMVRKLKRGSKIQLDAGRLNAIMQQQVNTPCCRREFDDDDHQRCSLFHKSPRQALPAARVRARARDSQNQS